MNKRDISMWSVLKILGREKIRILFWTILNGFVLWLISVAVIVPEYTASASLYVYSGMNRTAADDEGITSSELNASVQLADTYSVIIQSDTVLDKVIHKMELSMSEEDLRKMIEVSTINNTEVLSVSVTDTNPQRAQEIANTIVEVLPDELIRVVKAGGIEVVDYAKIPEEPVSPNIWMNTLAGILIGFFCSCGVFILREYFNTKITGEEDLQDYFKGEIPILGIIPMIDRELWKEDMKDEDRKKLRKEDS